MIKDFECLTKRSLNQKVSSQCDPDDSEPEGPNCEPYDTPTPCDPDDYTPRPSTAVFDLIDSQCQPESKCQPSIKRCRPDIF